jgi:hypothetical protein
MAEFGRRIGVSAAYVTSMRKSIQPEKLEKIRQEFPELDINWLLTGVSNSDPPLVVAGDVGTPVYNIDATCGDYSRPIQFLEEHIIGRVQLPNVSPTASIIRANGDSMAPHIHDGDWIAVRQVFNLNEIFYGQVYLVITSENRFLKYVRRDTDEKNYVILRSDNPEYDDIRLPKKSIKYMFLVENVLSIQIKV